MELTIRACEGGFYLASLSVGSASASELVTAGSGHLKFQSLEQVKDYFSEPAPEKVWLVHNVAYDEMIGLPSNEKEHKQPLAWYQ